MSTVAGGCKSCELPGGRRDLRPVVLMTALSVLVLAGVALFVALPGLRPGLLAGLGLGVAFTVVLGIAVAPAMLLKTFVCRRGLDDTVAAVQAAMVRQGWTSPGTVELPHGVLIVHLWQPEYAGEILREQREVAALLPGAIAVYEGDDGQVRVAKMNTGLLGKLFGGAAAEVMGGAAARDEAAILDGIVEQ